MTNTPDVDCEEIRFAVVMNGGVSLAVWISGVTLELEHLAMGRRWGETTYGPLLDLLNADAWVDVIAGTSAGGLNGAFLALGLARDRDIALLRDLWRDQGSLEKLLRDPLSKNPPSLMMGDDYFLGRVRAALGDVVTQPDRTAGPKRVDRSVELILTGTLWQGRSTTFTDDMGAPITEMDHDATFRFAASGGGTGGSGDLRAATVLDELAAAARCTSSFPGAFEPHWVEVTNADAQGDGPWASSAGMANFRESQYVIDGGVLLNKPIRPALEAVHRQTAGFQVRRVLAYVAPEPGERLAVGAGRAAADRCVPQAREVLLGVLARLRSTDSISRELAEIRAHNREAHSRRRARDRLATAMTGTVTDGLSGGAWQGYLEVRVDLAARTIGRLVAAGQPVGSSRWSEPELVAALRQVIWSRRFRPGRFFIPKDKHCEEAVARTDADWDWGQTTVQRLGDMTVDVLKRAVWLAPANSTARQRIVRCRQDVGAMLDAIRADSGQLDEYWSTSPVGADPTPPRRAEALGTATNTADLEEWLARILDGWDRAPAPSSGTGGRREALYKQAIGLADKLHECADAINSVATSPQPAIDPEGLEGDRLKALYEYLLAPARSRDSEQRPSDVLERMLRLDVVQLAFSGASPDVEQEVELVQFSATDPHALTGVQLHHFGAFYRPSWRVNDWLHGRMDGAAHIVRTLLSVERLRQRGAVLVDDVDLASERVAQARQARTADLLHQVHRAATSAASADDAEWLDTEWRRSDEFRCRSLLDQLVTVTPAAVHAGAERPPGGAASHSGGGAEPHSGGAEPHSGGAEPHPGGAAPGADIGAPDAGAPSPVECCIQPITRSLQTHILREDLPALAEAIRYEGEDTPPRSRSWLASYDAATGSVAGPLPAPKLWDLWTQAQHVGAQRIGGEMGGDTFARTVAQAMTVAANTVGSPTKLRTITAVQSALRGYTLAVWAMVALLTGRSRFGARVVELVVAAGGVLFAAAIFVPAMPLGFTLTGLLLLLAGASAAALLTREARAVGVRLAGVSLLAAAVLSGYVYWDWTRHGLSSAIWSLMVKVFVGVLVVLVGWWVAKARPPSRRRRSLRRAATRLPTDPPHGRDPAPR
jgi:patatin-related protein